jgi:phage shock protein E
MSRRRAHGASPRALADRAARAQRTSRIDRASPASSRASTGWRSRLTSGPARWLGAGIGAGAIVLVVALAAGFLGRPASATPGGTGSDGTVVQANGGQWTNITPDRLAAMLGHKDFTLLNVKTPYIGEIAGTDLYIPYDQVTARAAELPSDKGTKLVVYCRSGHESAIAAQALIDLGYTNIDNLDGGMDAWTASGRQLVTLNRTGG